MPAVSIMNGEHVKDRETCLKAIMLRGLEGEAAARRILLTDVGGHLRPCFNGRLPGGAADTEDHLLETLIAIHETRATCDVPKAGKVLMWESWLRHEVPPNAAKSERISVTFNYA